MEHAGFERLGVRDVPGASWVIPSGLNSKDLKETIDILNKIMVNPRLEGLEDPRKLLQRKEPASVRNETHEVNFGSESEGEEIAPDEILFPPNPRSKSNALDELKKKRKKKSKTTEREPLDEETLEARRESRLTNNLARQAKIKSDLFIHASDEESDADGDQEFFRLEEQRRQKQAANVKKAMLLGITENPIGKGKKASVRKRKSDTGASASKRRRHSGSESNDGNDDDEDVLMADVDVASTASQQASPSRGLREDENTPLTSEEDELMIDDDLSFGRDNLKPATAEVEAGDEDEDEAPVVVQRRTRGGFVIDSDSE